MQGRFLVQRESALSCVKTYPELNREALRIGQDRELALWYLLRFLDKPGSGRVFLDRLTKVVTGKRRLWSQANLERRLARGEGRFWKVITTEHGQSIRYASLEAVCGALGVVPHRDPVGVPLRAFRRLAVTRAYLYAAWVKDRKIGRGTIAELTGLSERAQRRYGKLAGIQQEKNLAVREYQRGDQLAPGRWVARDRRGRLLYNARMVNTYTTELMTFARGQLRKVRKGLRGTVEAVPTVGGRRYFRDAKQAARCRDRGDPYYVDRGRSWHGARLWDACGA